MSFGLYYLRFADGGCVADPLLYSTSYLVSQLVGHHMSYEGEECQYGRTPVINLSGELRLQSTSLVASVATKQ